MFFYRRYVARTTPRISRCLRARAANTEEDGIQRTRRTPHTENSIDRLPVVASTPVQNSDLSPVTASRAFPRISRVIFIVVKILPPSLPPTPIPFSAVRTEFRFYSILKIAPSRCHRAFEVFCQRPEAGYFKRHTRLALITRYGRFKHAPCNKTHTLTEIR